MNMASAVQSDVLVYGNTIVDLRSQSVMVNNQREFLAPKEFLILNTMLGLGGRPLQVDHLKNDYPDVHNRILAVHLSRIRKKLRTIGSNIGFHPVRDIGYCLVVN